MGISYQVLGGWLSYQLRWARGACVPRSFSYFFLGERIPGTPTKQLLLGICPEVNLAWQRST